ncbi:MAG: hypothetical protein JWM52_151 [Candidatus Saccharibacteria bacterium]|nr:hypothetical protein [Candidatus Saccharibacteria bacterium]
MALKSQIETDLKTALLSGDRFSGEVLRGLKAVILNEEVAQGKRDEGLDDATIEKLFAREVKKRQESATVYDGANRPELADNERAESKIIETYLPAQLSEDDIKKAVADAIATLGATDPSAMGQVIGAVKGTLGNAADGGTIARLVKEALS